MCDFKLGVKRGDRYGFRSSKSTTTHRTNFQKSARYISLLILYLMGAIALEVFMRYLLNRPTTWVWPIAIQVFGVYSLFAGLYTMACQAHIRIDMLLPHFPTPVKVLACWISILSIAIFLLVMIWQCSKMGWNSLLYFERDSSVIGVPVFILKLLIPFAAALLLWQSISDFMRKKF